MDLIDARGRRKLQMSRLIPEDSRNTEVQYVLGELYFDINRRARRGNRSPCFHRHYNYDPSESKDSLAWRHALHQMRG